MRHQAPSEQITDAMTNNSQTASSQTFQPDQARDRRAAESCDNRATATARRTCINRLLESEIGLGGLGRRSGAIMAQDYKK